MNRASQTRDKRAALRQVGETETWSHQKKTQPRCRPSTIGRDFKNTVLFPKEQEICVPHQAPKLSDLAQERRAPKTPDFENQQGLHPRKIIKL